MATYYLCSGFGPEHSFVNKFGEMLANDLKLCKSLVVIPCGGGKEETEAHVGFVMQQLEEVGIGFERKIILSEDMSREEQRCNIKDADLVYLMGGYPFSQKAFLEECGLCECLQKYSGVVLGVSAGAMNMSKYIIMVTDGANSDETRVEEGLGLVDFSVFPHCAFSGDTFAASFYIGPDLVESQKLLSACEEKGDVYFLQNKTETDTLKISFIRVKEGKKEFVRIYDGRVWKATENGFELIEEYI